MLAQCGLSVGTFIVLVLGLSQLVPNRFKTLCDRKFSKFVLPVTSVARYIAFVLCDKMVASCRLRLLKMFQIQRQHLAIQIVALGLTNIRATLHYVVLTRKCVARISKVAR